MRFPRPAGHAPGPRAPGALRPPEPERLQAPAGRRGRRGGQVPIFGKFSAKIRSFSAVSAPIFASKYAFSSIFQNLPDYLAEIFEIWQNFANNVFATFVKCC